MAIQLAGNSGVIVDADGATFRAVRTAARPTDHGSLGHYRVAATIPLLVSQAANGTLFSLRWGDATRLCAITKIRLSVMQTAAATATIMPNFEVFVARSFSVSDSGGVAVVLTGNNMKKRTNMGTSLVSDIRTSSVAAGLTLGTKTLDTQPVMVLQTQQVITTPNPNLYVIDVNVGAADGNHPFLLAVNEGMIIRGPTVGFGLAGTANLVVDMSWVELAAY